MSKNKYEDLIKESRDVSKDCLMFANVLAKEGHRRSVRARSISCVLVTVGAVSIVSTSVPAISILIGQSWQEIISLLVALALVASSLAPHFSKSDPPERFQDFAHYIAEHRNRIEGILSNKKLTDGQMHDALVAQLSIARANISDVRNKWPILTAKLDQ